MRRRTQDLKLLTENMPEGGFIPIGSGNLRQSGSIVLMIYRSLPENCQKYLDK